MTQHQHLGGILGTAAIVTLAAACSVSSPRVTFDGTTCRYEGPGTLTAGPSDLTFNNRSGEYAALAFLEMPEDATQRAEALALVGKDLTITDPDDLVVAGVILAEPGENVTEAAPLGTGSYLIDCATFTGDRPSHAWRAAAVEVR